MSKFLMCLLVFTGFCSAGNSEDLFDPTNTKIVIAGVLKWEDPKVSTFSDKHRKDKELYEKFIAMGVPDTNIVMMLDEEATLENMKKNIRQKMKSCGENTTFIFYYAGHGIKSGKKYFLCNYDMGKSESSQFNVSLLSELAGKHFTGKRVILMADCCYSGSLLAEGQKINKKVKEVVVMSSATSSNISTGNWTYTQTVLDNLNGLEVGDRDNNGTITLEELSIEIKDAMKYRERQLNGFVAYGVELKTTKVQSTGKKSSITLKDKSAIKVDDYVYALTKGNWEPARVKSINATDITCEFYDYSDKRDEIIESKFVHSIQAPDYSKLSKVTVIWEGKDYPATIQKTDGDFYYIKYDGYDDTWNEWIMYDRIKTGLEKDSQVEWNYGWYKGRILQEKDGKYFVTYIGYDHTWDEWVDGTRVK